VSQVTEIRTLQELDDEADKHRNALEEAERRLAGSEALESARSAFAAADTELIESRKLQRLLDGEIAGFTARIDPEEKRLYDGSVRNPKELANIQHELELLKEQRTKLEDQMLEVLARVEAAETEHKNAQKQLTRQEALREAEKGELADQVKAANTALTRISAKREAQRMKVVPRHLKTYDDVHRRRDGVAVARIAGANCGGCRVQIPEAIRRRAFNPDELAQCPNCERILFVG